MKTIRIVLSFIAVTAITGCSTVKVSSIERPIERSVTSWETIGHLRLELYATINETNTSVPYDQLLKKAHEKYGDIALDVIEIKVEKQTLNLTEKISVYKELNKHYSTRFIYNAIVVKYSSLK